MSRITLRKPRRKECEFRVSLGYTARHTSKRQPNKQKQYQNLKMEGVQVSQTQGHEDWPSPLLGALGRVASCRASSRGMGAGEGLKAGELTLPPARLGIGWPSWSSAGELPLVVWRKKELAG